MSYLKPVTATTRVHTSNAGAVIPWGNSSPIRTPSFSITAPNGNSGTIFIAFHATQPAGWNATTRRNTLIPLTAGQTFSFTGISKGSAAIHDISVGTGYTYILGSATTQRAILTYFTNSAS